MPQAACEAMERGRCREVYYDEHSVIGEVHVVGLNKAHKPAVLLFEKFDTAREHCGEWRFLPLDDAREIDVSGYFSDAPRPGYRRSDERFEMILCAL